MRAFAVVSVVAIIFSVGTVGSRPRVAAQTPSTPPAAQSESSSSAQGSENKVNIEGCVFPKRALGAKAPVTASPSGSDEYVLTDSKIISASPGLDNLDGRVFKIEGAEQERLLALTGLRAGVNGRVDMKPDTPLLQAISIWETVGSCPPVPTQTQHS